MSRPYGYIYLVTNQVTDKFYVGQTTRGIEYRWSQHVRNKRGCRRLHSSIKHHGPDAFLVEQVFECSTAEELNATETKCILALMSHHPLNGYNLTKGGDGHSFSEEHCKRISSSNKGRQFSSEHRSRLASAGKVRRHSEETKKRIALSGIGREVSTETRLKKSIAAKAHCQRKKESLELCQV